MYNPTEGIFYAIFFPAVFIIVFIWLLSNKMFPGHKGLKVLIAFAFYAFIIMQGWYYLFLILSKMWYVGLVILGFFWLALYGLRGGAKGGGGGAQARDASVFGGLGAALGKRAKARVTGEEHRLIKEIEMALEEVETIKHVAATDSGAWRMATSVIERLHALRARLEEMMSVSGFALGDFNKWDKRIQDAIKSLQHLQSSGAGHRRDD